MTSGGGFNKPHFGKHILYLLDTISCPTPASVHFLCSLNPWFSWCLIILFLWVLSTHPCLIPNPCGGGAAGFSSFWFFPPFWWGQITEVTEGEFRKGK